MRLKVKRLNEDARLPTKKYEFDAGVDLYSCEDVYIPPFRAVAVSTGIAVHVPPYHYGSIREKGRGFGIHSIVVGAGVLDEGYTGELKVLLKNASPEHYMVCKGDAIAQLVIQSYQEIKEIVEVDELPKKDSEREESGGIHNIQNYLVP